MKIEHETDFDVILPALGPGLQVQGFTTCSAHFRGEFVWSGGIVWVVEKI